MESENTQGKPLSLLPKRKMTPKKYEEDVCVRYVMVVLLEFYPSWLALPREERRKYTESFYQVCQ